MRESYYPDQRVGADTLDRFLAQEAEKLCDILHPVMSDAFYGVSNPVRGRIPDGYYESLLFNDINRPSVIGDDVAGLLVFSLTHRHGLRVEPAELPYNHLGVYTVVQLGIDMN